MSFDLRAFIDDLPTYEPPFMRGFPAKTGRAVLKSPRSGLKRRPKIGILPPVLFIGWYYWEIIIIIILILILIMIMIMIMIMYYVCIYIYINYHFCPTSVPLYVNYTAIIYTHDGGMLSRSSSPQTGILEQQFGAPIWPTAAAAGKTPTVVLPKPVRNTTFYRCSPQLALRLFI